MVEWRRLAMRFRTFPLLMILTAVLPARNLEISRPVRSWEFMDATGSRAAISDTKTA